MTRIRNARTKMPNDPAMIALATVQALQQAAAGTTSERAWRIYAQWRLAYRQWTLQRLAKIEADEG